MAINATNVQLNVAIVGDDQTGNMLVEAQKKVDALEKEMAELAKTAKSTQTAMVQSTTGLKSVNTQMSTAAKSAEGLVEGFDRTKGAFEKVTGALGFWGAAVTGAVALGSELISVFSDMFSSADKQAVAFSELKGRVDGYREAVEAATVAGQKFAGGISITAAAAANVEVDLARKRGMESDIGLAEVRAREAQAQVAKEAADRALDEARKSYDEARKPNLAAQGQMRNLEEEIAKRERTRREQTKEGRFTEAARAAQEKKELEAQRKTFQAAIQESSKGLVQVEKHFEKAKELHRKSMELAREPEVITFPELEITPDPPRTGGSGLSGDRRADTAEQAARRAKESREQDIRMNREFTAQVLENSRLREEREREEMRFAEEAAALRERFAEARERFAREDAAAPVLDFAGALTSNLVPALGEVEAAMARVTDIFEQFREGQMSMTEAIGTGAMEIAAFTAKSIGGVKAEAAVRAAYELAMGFATLTTPAISAGHFTAAAMLTGVATGVIGGGASASSKAAPNAAEPRKKEATATDKSGSMNVYNISAGIGDPQSIRRTLVQADRASSGTGYTRWGGV
jgi:hypothetical protein